MNGTKNQYRLRKTFFLCLLFVVSGKMVTAQTFTSSGIDFWLAYPKFIDLQQADYILYISSKQPTSGTVSIPGTTFKQEFTTTASKVLKVQVPSSFATIDKAEVVMNLGIHVESKNPISLYGGTIHKARSEVSLILPTQSLSNEYRVLTYPTQSKNNTLWKSEFIVVATQDKTRITIVPSCKTSTNREPEIPFSIELDQGEVYMVQAKALGDDVSGTHIFTEDDSKRIAVFAGHEWATVLCGTNSDPLYEQMLPINTWGKSHIVPSTPKAGKDVCRIMSASNNNTITINGKPDKTLNAGEVYEFAYTSTILVESSNPVAVALLTITAVKCSNHPYGDPSLIQINSNEQMLLDSITFFTVGDYNIFESHIIVVTRTTDTSLIELNQNKLSGFKQLEANPNYSYLSVQVPIGSQQLTSTGCGFLAYTIGLGDAESYAYSAGVSVLDLTCGISILGKNEECNTLLTKEEITFKPCIEKSKNQYEWLFSDGETSSERNVTRRFEKPGAYWVRLITKSACHLDTNYSQLVVKDFTPTFFPDTTICISNDPVFISVEKERFVQFLWNDGNKLGTREIDKSGNYFVEIEDSSGCSFIDSFEIRLIQSPSLANPDSVLLCLGEKLNISASAEASEFTWSNGSTGSEITLENFEGELWVYAKNQCGVDSGKVTVQLTDCYCNIIFPTAFSPNDDMLNDEFGPVWDCKKLFDYGLSIYNRWGEKVFQSTQIEEAWDGTINGVPVPAGLYLRVNFYIGFVNNQKRIIQDNGTVFLMR